MQHGQLIQAKLIIILLAASLCIVKIIKNLNYYRKYGENRNKNSINSKKNKDNISNKEYKNECCKSILISIFIIIVVFILSIIVIILLELIFKNLNKESATLIAGVIAVVGVCFTIRENQKMRLAQTITKSRIDWMQLIRKFIHEYLGHLNELESADNLSDKIRILIELYTARDKIISYLNPEAGYRRDENNKLKMCENFMKISCNIGDECDPDCVLIKELKKLEITNLKKHRQEIIKITRCYFKAERERAKWEGYTGKVLNYNDIEKDEINDKFSFKKKFDSYYNKKYGNK